MADTPPLIEDPADWPEMVNSDARLDGGTPLP